MDEMGHQQPRQGRGRQGADASGGARNECRRRRLLPAKGAQGKEGAGTSWIETMSSSGKTEAGVEPES